MPHLDADRGPAAMRRSASGSEAGRRGVDGPGLIKDHPIAKLRGTRCEARDLAEAVPSDPSPISTTIGVAEIVGWVFDRDGRLIEGVTDDRVAAPPLPSRERSLMSALAMGENKLSGILAATTRRRVNGLMTDERTATGLLAAG